MSDEKKVGDINVKMGSGNTIGHIGHKITFHQPPPDPNAIWQNGRVIGTIGSAPEQVGDALLFQKLFIDGPFDDAKEFSVQGVSLRLLNVDVETKTSTGGRPPQRTFWRAVCALVR